MSTKQEASTGKREHEQGHKEGLRAAHNIVLRAEPYCVDIHPKICVLRSRRDVAKVKQQSAEQCRRRDDISRDVHPLFKLPPGRLVAAHLASPAAYGELVFGDGLEPVVGGEPESVAGGELEPVVGGVLEPVVGGVLEPVVGGVLDPVSGPGSKVNWTGPFARASFCNDLAYRWQAVVLALGQLSTPWRDTDPVTSGHRHHLAHSTGHRRRTPARCC